MRSVMLASIVFVFFACGAPDDDEPPACEELPCAALACEDTADAPTACTCRLPDDTFVSCVAP